MRDGDRFDVGALPLFHSITHSRSSQPSIIRLGVLLLLFDVYLTWARIEKQTSNLALNETNSNNFLRLAQQPIVLQYMFFRMIPEPNPWLG